MSFLLRDSEQKECWRLLMSHLSLSSSGSERGFHAESLRTTTLKRKGETESVGRNLGIQAP